MSYRVVNFIFDNNAMAERSTTARYLSWFSLLLMASLGLTRAGYFNHAGVFHHQRGGASHQGEP